MFGGDGQYFYVGNYKADQNGATATIKVTHYAGPAHSVFGNAKEFSLSVSGKPAHDSFKLSGHVVGRPNLLITIAMTRRAELP